MRTLAWARRALALGADADARAIRAAYARSIKSFDPDDDPARFAALREARDIALAALAAPVPEPAEASGFAGYDDDRWTQRDDDRGEDGDENRDRADAPALVRAIPLPPPERLIPGAPLLARAPVPAGLIAARAPLVAPLGSDMPGPNASNPGAPAIERGIALPWLDLRAPLVAGFAGGGVVQLPALPDHALIERMAPHYDGLPMLLFPPDAREPQPPTPDERAALEAHLEAILADPRLATIDFHDRVETWLAGLLADAIPRSDPLLPRAAAYFDWRPESDRIGRPDEVHAVIARVRDLAFVAAISEKSHPLHRAWVELCTPAHDNSRRGRFVRASSVGKLIATVRRDHPDLERHWDWMRITLWTQRPTEPSAPVLGIFIFVFILLAHAFVNYTNSRSNPAGAPVLVASRSAPLVDGPTDSEAFLARAFGTATAFAIADRNQGLMDRLQVEWNRERGATDDQLGFAKRAEKALDEYYRRVLVLAPYNLGLKRIRVRRDQARYLAAKNPSLCVDFLVDGKDMRLLLPDSLMARQREAAGDILALRYPEELPPRQEKIAIPDDVAAAAAKHAALTLPLWHDAMKGEGSTAERCRARLGLLEAMFTLPIPKIEPVLPYL